MKNKGFIFTLIFATLIFALLPAKKAEAAGEAIAIDGYYDDWEMVPKTKISYGSHNQKEYHELAIVIDGDYLCVYVKMSDLYASQVPIDGYTIAVHGKQKTFVIRRAKQGGMIDYSNMPYNLPKGSHTSGLGVFDQDGGNVSIGEVAITVADKQPNDQMEFRIPLETLENVYHFSKGALKNGTKISVQNWNIGPEKATVVGTSTGAVQGIVLCAAVSGGLIYLRERKKRHEV